MTNQTPSDDRRLFLMQAAATGASLLLLGGGKARAEDLADSGKPEKDKEKKKEGGDEDDVSPSEDLMREHGLLKRVLLIYGEGLRRMDAREELPPDPFHNSARIIKSFVEEYHEKLEEDHLFPRFRKANHMVELVDTLKAQHDAGRKVTERIIELTTGKNLKDVEKQRQLAIDMRQFIRMYNPHEAREDTILFPAFRKLVSKNEYDALGEDFEKEEHRRFGEDGFEGMVAKVAEIEKTLGIYDLAQFTPKV